MLEITLIVYEFRGVSNKLTSKEFMSNTIAGLVFCECFGDVYSIYKDSVWGF